ncbi:Flp pilus assembly complex ATPase component TadA [Candidatus Microgenomates bacterium]|nr:Flp pilus assembly complex ATPase component TadA [Candidatus Microgenomates bacterium]
MNFTPKVLLAQLIKNGVIDQKQADHFELESLQKNLPIYEYLLQYSELKRSDVLQAAAQLLNITAVDLISMPIEPEAVSLISESIARRYRIVPFKYDQDTETLHIATTEPFDTYMSEFISRKVGKKIVLALADGEDIDRSLEIAYAQGGLTPEVKAALKEYVPETPILTEDQKISASIIKEAPVAKIVSTILEFAAKSRASDIHIEPETTKTRVRYRIDGFLNEKLSLPMSLHDALVSRIKILSQMKIDERRTPQDGRFTFKLGQEEIDLRVSTLPTVHGEKVVMRLLKKTGGIPGMPDLGLRGPTYKDLELAITKPYGIILVTGPTGSGKTTTLYSMLSRLNKPTVNILTLEDPVEYDLPGTNQVQINPQAGLTFASGLRSFLRQDPNIILVGEIRATETTQLAIQAALTGHLVFSTLHTNDSATAIPRLIDLGAEPFLISTVLNGVLAQRIVRRICESCREKYVPDVAVQANIREVLGDLLPQLYVQGAPIELYRGRGCEQCGDTGYLGRVGIFEITMISNAINKMIIKQVTAREIETQARQEGMILMKQDGYLKALDGLTTIEETLRVSEI